MVGNAIMKLKSYTNQQISEKMYIMKAVAIVSVITAHSNYFMVSNPFVVFLLGRFCRVGVFSFFLISGYYYKPESFCAGIKKILIRLVLPWFFLGSLMYLLAIRADTTLSVMKYVNNILGNGSTLYFCTMLFLIKLIALFLPRNKRALHSICFVCLLVTLISLFITAVGLLPQDSNSSLNFYQYLNPYLNICNWIGIYTLGIIVKEYNLIEKIINVKWLNIILNVSCLIVILLSSLESDYSYWSFFGIYSECAFFVIIMNLIFKIRIVRSRKYLINIGKNTFPIFMLHYPILSILYKVFRDYDNILLAFVIPIICVLTVFGMIWVASYIAKRLYAEKILKVLIGINI